MPVFSAPSFHKIGRVVRATFEAGRPLTLEASNSPAQGGGCQGAPTDDLTLTFEGIPDWVDGFDAKSILPEESFKPCDVAGRPIQSGQKFQLRLSFRSEKGKHLEAITYSSSAATYVDQWMSDGKNTVVKNTKTGKVTKKPELTKGISEFFENPLSWQKISGDSKESTDLNSPELDKFRDFAKEKNVGILAEPVERLPLKLPILDLPLISFVIGLT